MYTLYICIKHIADTCIKSKVKSTTKLIYKIIQNTMLYPGNKKCCHKNELILVIF